MEILSQNLRTLRKAKNWSQQAVARQLYLTPAAYCHYEKGRIEPSLSTLRRLSSIYGVTLDELVNTPVAERA